MTDFYTQLRLMALLLVALGVASCSSTTPKIEGVPSNLPEIDLHGSAATPPHSMSKADYPFDANGNYVTAWAALGGRGISSGHAEESSEPVSRKSKKSSGRSRIVEDSPPEPAARSSASTASRSRGEDITPSSHRGGAPKPKLVTKSKSGGTASKKSSADDDSPKPKKKKTASASDSPKPKKKSDSSSDSPKPKKKSDSSGDSPKPKKKSGSTSDSPKPKKKKPSTEG